MSKIKLPFIIKRSRLRSAAWFIIMVMVLAIGIQTRAIRESTILMFMLIFVFGGSASFYLRQLLEGNSKPRLKISDQGVYVADWNVGTIFWCDLSEIFVKSDLGTDYLCVTLRDPDSFHGHMNKLTRSFSTSERLKGFGDFAVRPKDMGLDTEALLELMRDQMQRENLQKGGQEKSSIRYVPGRD